MRLFFILFLFAAVIAAPLFAQSIEFSGQVRERSEFDDRRFYEDAHHDVYHQLRSRLRATATLNEQVQAVVEVQDARMYGSGMGTMNYGASFFDLRQGYIDVDGLADGVLGFRLGRQVLSYGNERLLGAIDWSNLGQSFDAGVLRLTAGDIRIDAIGAALQRNLPYPTYLRDHFLAGVWAMWTPERRRNTVQAFFLYDHPAMTSDRDRQNRMTAGVHAGGQFFAFDYEVDAAVQMGDHFTGDQQADINANMVGVRLGYTFPSLAGLRIGVGYDRLSGRDADNPEDYTVFNTLYGTNHKFYGYMDYFTVIPAHTAGMGLQDMLVQLSIAPIEGFKLGADIHLFSTASDPADFPNEFNGTSRSIGTEVDVTAKWIVARAVHMTLGYSVFSGQPDRILLHGPSGNATDLTNWAYLMTSVNF
ncbi:MAG: alginate export family protein [Bacteroidetes bacterium]|nr:alginate export family protein [Bacteroidota bacterium]